MKEQLKKIFFSLIISFSLVYFLLTMVDAGDIIKTLANVPLHTLFIGSLLYSLAYVFRAFRFRLLLNQEVRPYVLFNIVAVHNMWINLLPFRSGEFSYLYLLKKRGRAGSYLTGVPSLVLARVFDLMAISLLFLCSYVGMGALPEKLKTISLAMIVFVFLVLFFLIILIVKREAFLNLARTYIVKFKLNNILVVQKVLDQGMNIIQGFDTIKVKTIKLKAFILSVLIWISINTFNFVMVKAVGLNLTFWQILFMAIFFILFSFLPIHGYAGFGTTEALWALMVHHFGVTTENAISSGFAVHVMTLVIFMILGMFCHISLVLEEKIFPRARD